MLDICVIIICVDRIMRLFCGEFKYVNLFTQLTVFQVSMLLSSQNLQCSMIGMVHGWLPRKIHSPNELELSSMLLVSAAVEFVVFVAVPLLAGDGNISFDSQFLSFLCWKLMSCGLVKMSKRALITD